MYFQMRNQLLLFSWQKDNDFDKVINFKITYQPHCNEVTICTQRRKQTSSDLHSTNVWHRFQTDSSHAVFRYLSTIELVGKNIDPGTKIWVMAPVLFWPLTSHISWKFNFFEPQCLHLESNDYLWHTYSCYERQMIMYIDNVYQMIMWKCYAMIHFLMPAE